MPLSPVQTGPLLGSESGFSVHTLANLSHSVRTNQGQCGQGTLLHRVSCGEIIWNSYETGQMGSKERGEEETSKFKLDAQGL